jgi:DNA polymerase
MHEGLTDYLEIMRLAGVSELKKERGNRAAQSADIVPAVASPPPCSNNAAPPEKGKTVAEGVTPVAPAPEYRSNEHSKTDDSKAGQLRRLAEEVAKCTLCRDLAESRTQTVFGVGNPDSPLVFLGEAPGRDEDEQGEPFVGRAGGLLNDIITKGMKLRREDVYICNILRCRPPGNRNPMPDEAWHCRPFLDRTLEIIKPKFICCLGAIAAKNLLASEQTIGAMRGKILDYNGIKVVCTYHPAYLLRNPTAKKDTWNDIQLLMREMEIM